MQPCPKRHGGPPYFRFACDPPRARPPTRTSSTVAVPTSLCPPALPHDRPAPRARREATGPKVGRPRIRAAERCQPPPVPPPRTWQRQGARETCMVALEAPGARAVASWMKLDEEYRSSAGKKIWAHLRSARGR